MIIFKNIKSWSDLDYNIRDTRNQVWEGFSIFCSFLDKYGRINGTSTKLNQCIVQMNRRGEYIVIIQSKDKSKALYAKFLSYGNLYLEVVEHGFYGPKQYGVDFGVINSLDNTSTPVFGQVLTSIVTSWY